MAADQHHVIIGNGVAGNRAAAVLRERDPDNRITIISIGGLLFYDRYQLPQVFQGKRDWRDYLVHPPDYYEEQRITVRRKCRVTQVDPTPPRADAGAPRGGRLRHAADRERRRRLSAADAQPSTGRCSTTSAPTARALATAAALPEGGTAIMLGGDILGPRRRPRDGRDRPPGDPARRASRRSGRTRSTPEDRAPLFEALERRRHRGGGGRRRSSGSRPAANGGPARRVVLADGRAHRRRRGDAVLRSDALARVHGRLRRRHRARPAGQPELRTTDPHIWAAGDVCQIWSAEDNAYRFYYGWKNVKAMGELAARNMTGGEEPFQTFVDETLTVDGAAAGCTPRSGTTTRCASDERHGHPDRDLRLRRRRHDRRRRHPQSGHGARRLQGDRVRRLSGRDPRLRRVHRMLAHHLGAGLFAQGAIRRPGLAQRRPRDRACARRCATTAP